jgi:hypothetical protein
MSWLEVKGMAKILVAGQVKNLLGVIVWSSKAGNMMYRAVCTGEWVLTWFKKGKKETHTGGRWVTIWSLGDVRRPPDFLCISTDWRSLNLRVL